MKKEMGEEGRLAKSEYSTLSAGRFSKSQVEPSVNRALLSDIISKVMIEE